jgi:hypothetical protein
MKIENIKKRLLLLPVILLLFLVSPLNAQVPEFVSMDGSMQQLLNFYQTDTILVVIPNGCEMQEDDKETIEKFAFWMNDLKYIYILEADLHTNHKTKHLQFFGPAYLFETACLAEIPFKVENKGFSYQGRKFLKPEDSFYYMNNEATRIYTCTNGDSQPPVYIEYLAGGVYQLYVFNGSNIVFSGFDRNDGSSPDINDMDALRLSYFCQHINSHFFDLQFACGYSEIKADSLAAELDRFAEELCSFLEAETAGLPEMTTYVYRDRKDLQSFIAANSSQTVYGKSFGNVNHIMNFDLEIFKHEAGHSIIGNRVGINTNPFFNEGFRQYTDYFFSSEAYENDLRIMIENVEMLTPGLVLATDFSFFNTMVNYSISGVFVKYLIDRIGLEEFKTAYSQNHVIETVEELAGPLEVIIHDFKLNFKAL